MSYEEQEENFDRSQVSLWSLTRISYPMKTMLDLTIFWPGGPLTGQIILKDERREMSYLT